MQNVQNTHPDLWNLDGEEGSPVTSIAQDEFCNLAGEINFNLGCIVVSLSRLDDEEIKSTVINTCGELQSNITTMLLLAQKHVPHY